MASDRKKRPAERDPMVIAWQESGQRMQTLEERIGKTRSGSRFLVRIARIRTGRSW